MSAWLSHPVAIAEPNTGREVRYETYSDSDPTLRFGRVQPASPL